MNSPKNWNKSLKLFFQTIFYELLVKFSKIDEYIGINIFRMKLLFLPRLQFYVVLLIVFYIFQSHLDYMMYENFNFIEKYITSYQDFIWRDRTFYFFFGCFIIYTIYFCISLISIKLYDYISLIGKSLAMVFFIFTFKYYAWFYELELNYFYTEGNFFSIFLLYFFMYWGVHAIEFGYNLEEEFDDPKWNRLSQEAKKKNSFQEVFGWFHRDLSKSDESKISDITQTDELMSQIFGDIDDYGEDVSQTLNRYTAHRKRMYPGFISFEDMTDEEREYEMALRKFLSTPSNIEETIDWSYYTPEKVRNFYANRIKPYFYKYRFIVYNLIIFWDWIKVGFLFRSRAVGLYSTYNPRRKFNENWYKLQRFDLNFEIPFFKRTLNLGFIYLFLQKIKNRIKKISIFYFMQNLKWNNFHFRYYPRIKKLRKWNSGNYSFFKNKNI